MTAAAFAALIPAASAVLGGPTPTLLERDPPTGQKSAIPGLEDGQPRERSADSADSADDGQPEPKVAEAEEPGDIAERDGAKAATRTAPDAQRSGETDAARPDPATPNTAADLPCALPTRGDAQMAEGIPTKGSYSRSTGTVRALTLMIDFPGTPGEGTARQRFAEFFPQTSHWFARSSYGRLDYRPATPIPHWLRMPRPFAAYDIERGSPYEPGYQRLLKDIVATADERVDFSRYDLINVLVTPNAGPSAAQTVLSVTFANNDRSPRADGVRLSNVSFVYSRQDDGSGTLRQTGYRVLPHENNHSFGLPDLYTESGAGQAGHWDLMSEDWGANNDLLGWHKWKLGWLSPRQIDCVTNSPNATARPGTSRHTLSPLARRGGGTKLAYLPVSRRGGYAVEARTNEGNDDAVCKPGVLIYWVDVHKDSGQGPVTVMDSTRDTKPPHPPSPDKHHPHQPSHPPASGRVHPKAALHSTPQGCTTLPNVHPGLSDAAFTPGQTFTDKRHGVRVSISVTDRTRSGDYPVKITRHSTTN